MYHKHDILPFSWKNTKLVIFLYLKRENFIHFVFYKQILGWYYRCRRTAQNSGNSTRRRHKKRVHNIKWKYLEYPGFTKEFVDNLVNGFLISPFIPMKANNCAISSAFHIIFNSNHVMHNMIHLMDRRPQPHQKNYLNWALNLSRTSCEYAFYFCLQTGRKREGAYIYL